MNTLNFCIVVKTSENTAGAQGTGSPEQSAHDLMDPDPDSRLRGGGEQAPNSAFSDVAEGSASLLDDHGIGLVGELGLQSRNLRLRLSPLRCIDLQLAKMRAQFRNKPVEIGKVLRTVANRLVLR